MNHAFFENKQCTGCKPGEYCTFKYTKENCEDCYEVICSAADGPGSSQANVSSGGISSGAIIGIVCGVLGVIAISLAIFLIMRARRRRQLERVIQGSTYSGEFSNDGVKSKEEESIYGIQSIFNKAEVNHLEQGFYSDNDLSAMNTLKKGSTALRHNPILKSISGASDVIESSNTGTSLTNFSVGKSKLAVSVRSTKKEDAAVGNFNINAPLPTPIPESNEDSNTRESDAIKPGFEQKMDDRFQNDIV